MVAEYGSPGSPGGPSETPEKPAPSAPQGETVRLHRVVVADGPLTGWVVCPLAVCGQTFQHADFVPLAALEALRTELEAERRATKARIEAICAQNFEAQSDLVDQIDGLQNKLRTAKRELTESRDEITEARAALDAANERLGLMGDPCKYVPVAALAAPDAPRTAGEGPMFVTALKDRDVRPRDCQRTDYHSHAETHSVPPVAPEREKK